MAKFRHKTVAMGGTFDHFHAGHQHFIDFAADLGTELRIGITHRDLTLHKKFANEIQPYGVRVKAVQKYCDKQGYKVTITQLNDVFGPTLENNWIAALAVTEWTQEGAQKINQTRQVMSMRPLPVHVCQMLTGSDGEVITSTRIRAGEINREGKNYASVLTQKIIISNSTKNWLKKQHGEIIYDPSKSVRISYRAVVGDIALETFRTSKWNYHLGIFDKKNQRKAYTSPVLESIKSYDEVINPPGEISLELIESLKKNVILDNPPNFKHIKIEGEEDLATTALILLLPLSACIYYGQHGEGVVECIVTEQLKESVFQRLSEDSSR